MPKRSLLTVGLVVVFVLGLGTSASAQLGDFVQAAIDVQIQDGQECRTRNIYDVPFGKRLRIDWISVSPREFGSSLFVPVDVSFKTRLGGVLVTHRLIRIEDAEGVGSSLFGSQIWSSPVTMYNQGGRKVMVLACRDSDTFETSVDVTFHGQLFDEP